MVVACRQADHPVEISLPETRIVGHLRAAEGSRGIVVFANGVGARRFAHRDGQIASVLHRHGLATLMLRLLLPDEESLPEALFNVGLLAERLVRAIDWLGDSEWMNGWPVGLIGAGTGAGAALVAAARRPGRVDAVVSRGGRPDLAVDWLDEVEAPTLLIVGGADLHVAQLNKSALHGLTGCECALAVVPGATHLFPEPGAIEEVARLARDWFVRHLNGGEAGDHGVGIQEG